MAAICNSAKELSYAVKRKENEIIIEGDLKKGVVKIKAVGNVSWGICAGALAFAIVSYLATPTLTVAATPAGGGLALSSGFVMSSAASTVLGSAVVPAVAIGVSAGGVGVLTKLRKKYKVVEETERYIKLRRN